MDGEFNQNYQNFHNFIQLLQLQDGQDLELRKLWRGNFLQSLENFRIKWEQCVSMTQLNDYDALSNEITDIARHENTWFYIGYTNRLSDYLWTTEPKSEKAMAIIQNQQLVKTHTYYTQLRDIEGQNEFNLINMVVQNVAIIDHERCLNRARNGIHDPNGIVYCLVYEPQQP